MGFNFRGINTLLMHLEFEKPIAQLKEKLASMKEKMAQHEAHLAERAKVADSLVEKAFSEGEYVIREGERGENFYIVVGGEAKATKRIDGSSSPVEVLRYKRGDYFGELALLNDKPRAANVIALGDLRVVTLDRDSFVRLLGPCDDILKRNTDTYRTIDEALKVCLNEVCWFAQ